jgi:hypothetical protein
MGCHVWCYKRIERTQEEAKQSCLKKLNYYLDLWNKSDNAEIIKTYGYTDENINHFKNVLKRQIRMVENNLCQKAVWNHQFEDLTIFNEKGFFIYTDEVVLFRTWYNEKILYSYEETLDFIKNNECSCFEGWEQSIIDFWTKYPDGLIRFG